MTQWPKTTTITHFICLLVFWRGVSRHISSLCHVASTGVIQLNLEKPPPLDSFTCWQVGTDGGFLPPSLGLYRGDGASPQCGSRVSS